MGTLFTRLMYADGSVAFPARLIIRPVRGPVSRGGGMVLADDIVVPADNTGYVRTGLLPGRYRVWVGDSDPRTFDMPTGEATHLLEDLLGTTADAAPLNYRYLGLALQILNGTTGQWHTLRIAGTTPQVTLSAPDGDLESQNYLWETIGLVLHNDDAGEWQQIYVSGVSTPQLAVALHANPVSDNARVQGGRLQFLNVDTGLYHTIYVTGTGPTYTIAIGAGET